MISYCIASYRPHYSSLLIQDLVRKTTAPFEILIWLNVDDPEFEHFLEEQQHDGVPLRIVGKTPENIGMEAYSRLFSEAHHELIVQIDDDVVAISKRIAEQASDIFSRFPRVKQLVADVWQDEYTTGARPPMSCYRAYEPAQGLYDGPIDGWFSIFHCSALPFAASAPRSTYFPLGGHLKNCLRANGELGLLCTKFKVFHVIGPYYASYFGMLDFEIQKYQRLGRTDIVEWYESAKATLPPRTELEPHIKEIFAALE